MNIFALNSLVFQLLREYFRLAILVCNGNVYHTCIFVGNFFQMEMFCSSSCMYSSTNKRYVNAVALSQLVLLFGHNRIYM